MHRHKAWSPGLRAGCLALLLTPAAGWSGTPGTAPGAAAPAPGLGAHAARLCVNVSDQPAQCGEVQAWLYSPRQAAVRVADVLYRLQLRPPWVDVFVFHGSMQIDEFTGPMRWQGALLQFADGAKQTNYVVTWGAPAAPNAPSAAPASGPASAPE